MQTHRRRRTTILTALSAAPLVLAGTALAAPGGTTGPSSSDPPYLVRHVPGVTLTSLLTAGDAVGGYRMAGEPDGLGAFDNGDGTFTVLMNHELGKSDGVPRSHGNAAGSFVSRWVIDKATLRVLSGRDQITNLITSGSKDIDRLCSADLPALTAFYNPATGLGYNGLIFTNGEEAAPNGRAFAHVVDSGDSYELTALGRAGWENVVANPGTGDRTVVVGQSDGGTQNVYVYAGDKQLAGSPVERAGLTNGRTAAIAVAGWPKEDGAQAFPEGPLPFSLSDATHPATAFDRPEDGAWDPTNPNDYYFATTGSMSKHSRLWRLTFSDASRPEQGGTITKVLEGPSSSAVDSGGPKMMDNLTVNDRGQVLVQEDPGGNSYLAGVYQYDIATDAVRRIADHDPERFTTGGAYFDTLDEESSGIIPVPFLGAGAYLLGDQNHTDVADEAVHEKGQLLLLHVPPGQPVSRTRGPRP